MAPKHQMAFGNLFRTVEGVSKLCWRIVLRVIASLLQLCIRNPQ